MERAGAAIESPLHSNQRNSSGKRLTSLELKVSNERDSIHRSVIATNAFGVGAAQYNPYRQQIESCRRQVHPEYVLKRMASTLHFVPAAAASK
jgi:hypothetical protein